MTRDRRMKVLVLVTVPFASLLLALTFFATRSLPGDFLYPVRELLREVGIAEPSMEEVDDLIADARVDVYLAEEAASHEDDRYRALDPAVDAMVTLRAARDFLEDVSPPDKAIRYARIEGLERQATEVIAKRRDVIRGVTGSSQRSQSLKREGCQEPRSVFQACDRAIASQIRVSSGEATRKARLHVSKKQPSVVETTKVDFGRYLPIGVLGNRSGSKTRRDWWAWRVKFRGVFRFFSRCAGDWEVVIDAQDGSILSSSTSGHDVPCDL